MYFFNSLLFKKNVITNSKPIRDPETGSLFELDVYLPEYGIAFEYQVEYIIKSKKIKYNKN